MKEIADNTDFSMIQNERVIADFTDNELVSRVKNGDDAAFEELFNRHRRRVALIAGRFFNQHESIEEIVQESFTKAYFSINDFNVRDENAFAAWLARIAFNVCYDELRRIKRQPQNVVSDLSETDAQWMENHLRADSNRADIENKTIFRDLATKLMSKLSPEDRLILVMLEVEELSIAEIVTLTKWSASKIKVRAHRARASLRQIVKRFL
ncbi:MAG: RNA polymerase sigma factor [Pyrinomonadaceae bacterium]|nr:RNA polymerase sigma factor [Pyrinomonadaceae bacterium]